MGFCDEQGTSLMQVLSTLHLQDLGRLRTVKVLSVLKFGLLFATYKNAIQIGENLKVEIHWESSK